MKNMYGLMAVLALGSVGYSYATQQISISNRTDQDRYVSFSLLQKGNYSGTFTSGLKSFTVKAHTKHSVEIPARKMGDLTMSIEGYNDVKLPVTKTYKRYYLNTNGKVTHTKSLAPVK